MAVGAPGTRPLESLRDSGRPGVAARKAPGDYGCADFPITPQAIRPPEFPLGSLLWSSGPAWITSEVPLREKSEVGAEPSVTSFVK